jgi:Fe-S cluster biogenesis protein NfuA
LKHPREDLDNDKNKFHKIMPDIKTIKEKVVKVLERVRPYLQSDGGDIELIEVTDDMSVKVRLKGACHGCPYSMQTLKAGVEQAILKEVPEIKKVISA